MFVKDIYIIAFKGVNGFKNVSPGRFSEANNCDKFIKVTLVEICVYWKYLKCLHVHENRYQGENNSHVNKSAFGIDFL